MALVFSRYSKNNIIELSQKSNAAREIESIPMEELELMNEKIGQIISDSIYEPKLFERLMRRRSYIVLRLWST